MPLYEYQCKKCGSVFEVMQKFSDEPLKKHANCGGKVEKLMSAPAFHLKGTGWYVTDYGKSGSPPKEAPAEAKADTASETVAEKKTESKVESKPESKPAKKSSKPAPASS
jgi:putative FmdB family regulatory protein